MANRHNHFNSQALPSPPLVAPQSETQDDIHDPDARNQQSTHLLKGQPIHGIPYVDAKSHHSFQQVPIYNASSTNPVAWAYVDPSFNDPKTTNHGVDNKLMQEFTNEVIEPRHVHHIKRPGNQSWWTQALQLVVSLAWLGVCGLMLWLQYSAKFVGVSVGCWNCKVNPFDNNDQEWRAELDHRDHNVMGVLQFVAKALEVLFVYLCIRFVYCLAMIIGSKYSGLPLGLFTTHAEFGDLRYVFTSELWRSPSPPKQDPKSREPGYTKILYLFAVVVAFMSILVNLIGPSIAVLLIPSQQWRTINVIADTQFESLLADSPPTGSILNTTCTAADLAKRNYTCTLLQYGNAFDSQHLVFGAEAFQTRDTIVPATLPIGVASIVTNITSSIMLNETLWTPSYQAAELLQRDLSDLRTIEFNNNGTTTAGERPYLQITNQLIGPSLSFRQFCMYTNQTVINLAADKQVYCFNPTVGTLVNQPDSICIKNGSGWESPSLFSHFYLSDGSFKEPFLEFRIYSTESAVKFNSSIASFCGGTSKEMTCNWDSLFSETVPMNITYMTIAAVGVPEDANRAICISEAMLGFTTYSLAPNPPLNLIETGDVEPAIDNSSLLIHPDWFLAAWSISNNGTVLGGRGAAEAYVNAIEAMFYNPQFDDEGIRILSELNMHGTLEMTYLAFTTTAQSLSMIPYTTTSISKDSAVSAAEGVLKPVLTRSDSVFVWSYGNDSRTAKLGIAVTIITILVDLVGIVLGFICRTKEVSLVEMLLTAIKHPHTLEMECPEKGEQTKSRYYIAEDTRGEVQLMRTDTNLKRSY
jgi:hypothetical protein